MTVTAALVPGTSAAEYRCMQQGAREFFGTQGMDAPTGAGMLAGNFRALAAPAASREPALRETYNKRDGMHWMFVERREHLERPAGPGGRELAAMEPAVERREHPATTGRPARRHRRNGARR